MLPALLQAIFPTRRVWINEHGAMAGMVLGALLVLVISVQTSKYFAPFLGEELIKSIRQPPGVASLYALAANVIVALVVSFITGRRK